MFVILPVLLIAVVVGGLCIGVTWINPLELFNIPDDDLSHALIGLRISRITTAFTVGGALAVAGAAYQTVLRNPLAEPYILGISGGASLGAAIAIISGLSACTMLAVPGMAFVFAILAMALVLLMGRGRFSEYSENVLLSGVIVGAVCSSILMFIISTLNHYELNSVTWWMLGNLQAADNSLLNIAIAVTVIGTLLLTLNGRQANLISLGEEMAYNMGTVPFRVVMILLCTASLMTAASVSLAGIISFVGLLVPHATRRIFGADHRRLFILNLICGGIFLTACDIISRVLLEAQEVPVGVITALIGGPFFIWILNRKGRRNA
ncbi:MAG: iron ABC transporter permease [Lentisphaerae bacterium]|nr:iron ABC transporter permease [Lentisphaerota bacterium]MCP4103730.1 iron ABC transporter permease [Lentisphaerota bacterium]